jgi:hypothetical protein
MRSLSLLFACGLLVACQGSTVSPPPRPPPQPPGNSDPPRQSQFTCEASAVPSELPLRRLSNAQYRNLVTDLVTASLPAEASAVLLAVRPSLEQLPRDQRVTPPGTTHGGFTRMDQTLQQAFVDATYQVAVDVGRQLTASSTRLGTLMGACATDTSTANDAACLEGFVRRFGLRALRRPVPEEEVAAFTAVAGTTPVDAAAVADVVAMVLTSPYFLYHVEHGATAAPEDSRLDAYELASRLSFHFWQTGPDEALLAAAASGTLHSEEGYAQQVRRVFEDPRTAATLDGFFNEWWRLHELDRLDARLGDPLFDAFVGVDRPGPELHTRMMREVLDMTRHVTSRGDPVAALLTNRKSFARTEDLARLYGMPAWSGSGEPPDFTDARRVGLITRAALLASGSANTRPIMKGFRVRSALLCDTVPPPPDNAAANNPINLSPTSTTREVVEAITQQPGTACGGCHNTLLNPMGFATENFDALGRARTHQVLFSAKGERLGERSVDTRSVPQVIPGDERDSQGAEDVTRLLVESGRFESCLARQYFRFTFGRLEDTVADGCALAALESAAQSGASLADVLRLAALRPEFRRRTFR